jgi:hypothetical protein
MALGEHWPFGDEATSEISRLMVIGLKKQFHSSLQKL